MSTYPWIRNLPLAAFLSYFLCSLVFTFPLILRLTTHVRNQVLTMDIVPDLLSLVTENGVGSPRNYAFNQVTQKTVQFRGGCLTADKASRSGNQGDAHPSGPQFPTRPGEILGSIYLGPSSLDIHWGKRGTPVD